jgi:hypothetical protein
MFCAIVTRGNVIVVVCIARSSDFGARASFQTWWSDRSNYVSIASAPHSSQ